MKSTNGPILRNAQGFSLVEVIASILLLSLILLSFFTLFIQSNKTKQTSSEIVDATYLAQTEMERLYAISKDYPTLTEAGIINLLDNPVIDDDYDRYLHNSPERAVGPDNMWLIIEKQTQVNNLLISVKIEKKSLTLADVVIVVWDGEKVRTKMETTLKWAVTL